MKATQAKFLEFLGRSPQFEIPVYQRTYSWTERECRQLWDDILRTGADDEVAAHFVGSIVYIEESLYPAVGDCFRLSLRLDFLLDEALPSINPYDDFTDDLNLWVNHKARGPLAAWVDLRLFAF